MTHFAAPVQTLLTPTTPAQPRSPLEQAPLPRSHRPSRLPNSHLPLLQKPGPAHRSIPKLGLQLARLGCRGYALEGLRSYAVVQDVRGGREGARRGSGRARLESHRQPSARRGVLDSELGVRPGAACECLADGVAGEQRTPYHAASRCVNIIRAESLGSDILLDMEFRGVSPPERRLRGVMTTIPQPSALSRQGISQLLRAQHFLANDGILDGLAKRVPGLEITLPRWTRTALPQNQVGAHAG